MLYIGAAVVAIAASAFFLFKRLGQVRVDHSHNLSPQTADLVSKGLHTAESLGGKGFKTIDHAADTVGRVADAAVEIVKPVTGGVGSILDSVAGRIRTKQSELNELKIQSVAMAQEIERLNSRRINVTDMAARMKLGLISVSQNYSSWERKVLEEKEKTLWKKASETQYIGLQRATYQIQIGLDIERLRFQLTADDRILVDGLRDIEIIGLKGLVIDKPLAEVRRVTKTKESGHEKISAIEVLLGDSQTEKYKDSHTSRIMEEIQSSQSVHHLVEPNTRFALAFLGACFSAGGFQVIECKEALTEPLRFLDLCEVINQRVAQEIHRKQVKQIEADERFQIVEAEVLSLAMGKVT